MLLTTFINYVHELKNVHNSLCTGVGRGTLTTTTWMLRVSVQEVVVHAQTGKCMSRQVNACPDR